MRAAKIGSLVVVDAGHVVARRAPATVTPWRPSGARVGQPGRTQPSHLCEILYSRPCIDWHRDCTTQSAD